MALLTALKWLVSSPADHRPSAGLVFHWSAGMASAARKSSLCARARFSMMVASAGTSPHARANDSDCRSAGLLESMGQLQDKRFSERGSKDLQAHRQLSVDLAARYGNPWDSRQRPCNGIYISKIHLEGVVGALP